MHFKYENKKFNHVKNLLNFEIKVKAKFTYSTLSKSNLYLTTTFLSPLSKLIGPVVPPLMSPSDSMIRTFKSKL